MLLLRVVMIMMLLMMIVADCCRCVVGWLVVQARGGMIKGGPIVRTESESRPHPTKAHKQATKQGSKQEGTNPPENDKQGSATNSDSYGQSSGDGGVAQSIPTSTKAGQRHERLWPNFGDVQKFHSQTKPWTVTCCFRVDRWFLVHWLAIC